MKRIYVSQVILSEHISREYILDQENANYIKTVLRSRPNENILLFDGKVEALGTYNGKNIQIVQIIREATSQAPLKLAIAQIKQARFEWLIEKATEIGVSEIFIINTQFSQNHIRNFEKLCKRFHKIAIEAAKQSGRITIPKIHAPISLDKFIKDHTYDGEKWAFGHIEYNNIIKKNNINSENIALQKSGQKTNINEKFQGILIGPEGGV